MEEAPQGEFLPSALVVSTGTAGAISKNFFCDEKIITKG
jgi:hypothetical protein